MSTIWIAALCGLMYFLATSRVGYGLGDTAFGPIAFGFILGLIYGDVSTGLIIGATIQLVYLGMIATGGNIPADDALAGIIAIPIALQTGISPELALGIAIPFGVLGVFLDQIRRTTNAFWIHKADKYALQGNRRGVFHSAFTIPLVFAFFLRFTPVFIITLFGASAVTFVLDSMPAWIITGLSVAGGMLPAMGFAIIVMTIGKKELLPYFFIGFFAVAYLSIGVMAAAVFGTCIALLTIYRAINQDRKEAI